MRLKVTALAIIVTSCAVISLGKSTPTIASLNQLGQSCCKEWYPSDSRYRSGCKELNEGPYYMKSSELFDKTTYVCDRCPKNSLSCTFNRAWKNVEIYSCEMKYCVRRSFKDEVNDSCESCPPNSTKCSWNSTSGRVDVSFCEPKFYNPDNSCEACPENSLSCSFDKDTKKINVKRATSSTLMKTETCAPFAQKA